MRDAVTQFVAFDLETTGLSAKTDRIIEIGAVRFDREGIVLDRLESFVDAAMPIPLAVQRLTGIREADIDGAPSAAEAVAQLADFCTDAQLVGHGAQFDIAFVAAVLPVAFARRTVLDTLELARIVLPRRLSHSLPVMTADLGITHDRPHRALSDADATRGLFEHLGTVTAELPQAVLAALRDVLAAHAGPLREFFVSVVAGPGLPSALRWDRARARLAPLPLGAADVGESRGGQARELPVSESPGHHPGAGPGRARRPGAVRAGSPGGAGTALDEAAAQLLGPSGPFAAQPGYEPREEQIQMTRAVAQAVERNRRLLVEAGTGVGKSLAYLVPLALWTQRTGGRAVVATHTVNLQEQLAEKDLPALRAWSGLDVNAVMLKGRSHYLSLRRWERFLATPDVTAHESGWDRLRFKLKVLCWLAGTATGDRSELRLAAQEQSYWDEVCSVGNDCLGNVCANWRDGSCHMVAARRSAAAADIVVTNQALLLADAERQGQVLTAYDALVVDEAHHLESAATAQLGITLRAQDVISVLDRALDHLEHAGVAEPLQQARDAVQRVFGDTKGFIGQHLGSDQPGNATVGLTEALREQPAIAALLRSARAATLVLQRSTEQLLTARGSSTRESTRRARGAGPDGHTDAPAVTDADMDAPALTGGDPSAVTAGDANAPAVIGGDAKPQAVTDGEADAQALTDGELELAAAALGDATMAIDRVLLHPIAGHVQWLAFRAEKVELCDAPVRVDGALRELFDRTGSTVLTSATLAVGGDFAYTRSRLGLTSADELALRSPFDWLRQALAVLPTGIPPWDAPEHEQAMAAMLAAIAMRLRGGVLVLFTGYAQLRKVHTLLRPRLEHAGIAVLGQGLDGTRRQVLGGLLANPRTVVLGTNAFWEGIDVPGDALRCVVIDKLPFPVPTDPLVQARAAGLADPFTQLLLPAAVIRMKQGVGRLIRRGDDHGAVVLCDERLHHRGYGRAFMDALPPMPRVHTPLADVPAVVHRFVNLAQLPAEVTYATVAPPAGMDDWSDDPA